MGSSFAALTSGQDRRTPEDAYGGDEMPSTDETKGRIKEAAGDLANDKDLQREGKVDRAAGKAKEAVDETSDKVKLALKRD
jgi:uncharacterized protein YjbJ (UPF0337 family)